HDEIFPETLHADLRHEPDPARKIERERLGLLGRFAAILCLIEIYGHAPSADELRACLAKHIAFWQQRARKARADNKKREKKGQSPKPFTEPFLWVIAAGAPTDILAKLEVKPASGWPTGVYFFGDDVLRVGIVVASELPRDRSTLLVRLMAAGPLLTQAIEELGTLPPRAHERSVAEHILLSLQGVLRQKPIRSPEEQQFIMAMHLTWEHARADARAEGRADSLLTVLRARGIAVPAAVRRRILAQRNQRQLDRWLAKASVASSIE